MADGSEPKPDYAAFLTEYESLCRKYGVIIDGCGCCDSPFLSPIRDRKGPDGKVYHTADTLRDRNFDHLRQTVDDLI